MHQKEYRSDTSLFVVYHLVAFSYPLSLRPYNRKTYQNIERNREKPSNKHFAYVNFVADDYVVSTKLMVIRAKRISPRRLYQFLTTPDTLNELQIEAESRSGTFPQIRFDNIQKLEMIVASEQVEKDYSERLNTIYAVIDSNNLENKRLSALRETLLPKLMNGEIDVSQVQI